MPRFCVLVIAAACVVIGAMRGAADPHSAAANATGVAERLTRGRRATVLARRRRSTDVPGGRCDGECDTGCDATGTCNRDDGSSYTCSAPGCDDACDGWLGLSSGCDEGCDGACDESCKTGCDCQLGMPTSCCASTTCEGLARCIRAS